MTVSIPHRKSQYYRATLLLIAIAVTIIGTGCSVFGRETVEEAPYQLVEKENQFEIREYEPLIVAETLVEAGFKDAGNKAFRRLFAYISGENQSNAKISMTAPVIAEAKTRKTGEEIAMTAPVISEKEGEAWRYSFVLPKTFTMNSAPQPLNPDVSLAKIPGKRVAAIRFTGRSTKNAQEENAIALAEWIESRGLVSISDPRWAGYNAPWTLPPFRRNEVLVDVDVQ